MGKHEIPQYYLRGFASDHERTLIWQFGKQGEAPLEIPIRVAAQRRDFYPEDVEKFLAEAVEGPANPILDQLREQRVLDGEQRWVFARYVLAMSRRTSFNRDWLLENVIPEVLEKRFPELLEQLPKHQDAIRSLQEAWTERLPPELDPSETRPNLGEEVIAGMCLMTWRFLVAEGPSYFMTGDNPVFYDRHLGMGKPTSELTFPLSTRVALWLTWRSDLEERFYPTPQGAVREVNRRTAHGATRMLFYHKAAPWVGVLASRKKHRLTRLI